MKNLKIKLVTGYGKEEHHSIDAEEAHKAYFLFLNPEVRGVFDNGLALIGKDIRRIEPDYAGTMGWNPNHKIGPDDMNEIMDKGIDRDIRAVLSGAKSLAYSLKPEQLNQPLSSLNSNSLEHGKN